MFDQFEKQLPTSNCGLNKTYSKPIICNHFIYLSKLIMRFFTIFFLFFIIFKSSTVFSFELELDEKDVRLLISNDSDYLLKDLGVGDTLRVDRSSFCTNNGGLYILDFSPNVKKSTYGTEIILEVIPGQKVKAEIKGDPSSNPLQQMIISPMRTCKEILKRINFSELFTTLEVETVNGFNNQKDYIQYLSIEGYN